MTTEAMEIILADFHSYTISYSNKRWQTHVFDTNYSEGRRKIAKTSKEALIAFLFKYYGLKSQDAITLEGMYEKWLEYKRLHVSESSILRIESDWKKYYEGTSIVSVPIRSLTKLRLDRWIYKLIKEYNLTKTAYFNMLCAC